MHLIRPLLTGLTNRTHLLSSEALEPRGPPLQATPAIPGKGDSSRAPGTLWGVGRGVGAWGAQEAHTPPCQAASP